MKIKKIYYFLFALVLVVPLGLISSNPAWGEWGDEHYKQTIGFVPKAIENTHTIDAPFSDYTIGFLGDVGSYYFSAVLAIALLFAIFTILHKVIKIEKSKR